jgi:peptidase YpeB-like protein
MNARICAVGIIGILGLIGCNGTSGGEGAPAAIVAPAASSEQLSAGEAIAKANESIGADAIAGAGEHAELEALAESNGRAVWHVSVSTHDDGTVDAYIDAHTGEIVSIGALPQTTPLTCNGYQKPVRSCHLVTGWRCCGTDGWVCGVCF